ncbi:MAG: FHA domain-containing protein [Chloroflexaceae bacterium]|nr:FHA domain-containing protein [Chloroflexaceae bacterium]
MITLSLLHPVKGIPVQNWTFEPQAKIRVGRSSQNDVVLYSAVVSRHHLEIRRNGLAWELINLGANGTYVNGQRIAKMTAEDGMVVRLASSGPQIQIWISRDKQKQQAHKIPVDLPAAPTPKSPISQQEKVITQETISHPDTESR